MRCLFINNIGAGFADYIEVAPGTTATQFFDKQMPGQKPEDHLVRINRQPVAADQILQEGDRISISPVKIAGA
jgi:sulfur carrier protein ThiS